MNITFSFHPILFPGFSSVTTTTIFPSLQINCKWFTVIKRPDTCVGMYRNALLMANHQADYNAIGTYECCEPGALSRKSQQKYFAIFEFLVLGEGDDRDGLL